jgi:SAM-dependent methyltransferase
MKKSRPEQGTKVNPEKDYIEINRRSWNKRMDAHLHSDFYDLEGFMNGRITLNPIEIDLLGDLKGKSVLHLQCHFGQDTLSLERLGASVAGVDLSDKAIENALEIAGKLESKARFICCNIYDLPNYLDEAFDIVFTSYGTISWLPDLTAWASLIRRFLKPGGVFVFAEFHPVVWMFDDHFREVGYNYFNSGPIVENESGTYADRDARISLEYVCWNHSISEVVNSLIGAGLAINCLNEFDYSPYNCFRGAVEVSPGKFRIPHLDNKIPMVYSIKATSTGL